MAENWSATQTASTPNVGGEIGCQFADDVERIERQHQRELQQFQREFQKPHIVSHPFLFSEYSLPRRPLSGKDAEYVEVLYQLHLEVKSRMWYNSIRQIVI